MSARLPLAWHKTPFVLDPAAVTGGNQSPRRAAQRLPRLPVSGDASAGRGQLVPCANASVVSPRPRLIESVVLLQAGGGRMPRRYAVIGRRCLPGTGLGLCPPKATARGSFWSDSTTRIWRSCGPRGKIKKALFFLRASPWRPAASAGGLVSAGSPSSTTKRDRTQTHCHRGPGRDDYREPQASRLCHYEGGAGYQPMVAVWAEAGSGAGR